MIERDKANRDALRACAVLGLFFVAAAAGAYWWRLDLNHAIPRDGSSLVVGRDFLNFWMYGRAAWLPDPGQWYEPLRYARALAQLVGENYPGQNWSYPPSLMLLMAPFGRLEYLAALAAWLALGLAVFAPAAAAYLADRRAVLAVLCAPAAVFALISGQLSFLATAALIGGFMLLDRRPIVAGVLIGCLTLKPHLGILLPLMLAASGRWRVFASAAATAIALVAASIALFGAEPWLGYISIGLPVQNMVMADAGGIATPFYPTLFMNLRGIGVAYGPAMAVQMAMALVAAATVIWAFRYRRDADPRLLAALVFACTLAALPYVLAYDTLPLCVAAMALLAGALLDSRGRLLARLVFWLPLLQIGLGTFAIPGSALIAPAFALVLVLQLRTMTAAQPRTGAATQVVAA
jgi:hypothetical protein